MITVPVSVGELIDKLSILHVKKTKIVNEEKLTFINKEFELLYNMSSYYLNDIEISNTITQTAASGNVTITGNTTVGDVTSGTATNSSTNTISISTK